MKIFFSSVDEVSWLKSETVCLAGWQGEDLDAYKEFRDIEVIVANASKCQVVDVVSSTVITCDLPHANDKLLNLLNDDGDASVQVT